MISVAINGIGHTYLDKWVEGQIGVSLSGTLSYQADRLEYAKSSLWQYHSKNVEVGWINDKWMSLFRRDDGRLAEVDRSLARLNELLARLLPDINSPDLTLRAEAVEGRRTNWHLHARVDARDRFPDTRRVYYRFERTHSGVRAYSERGVIKLDWGFLAEALTHRAMELREASALGEELYWLCRILEPSSTLGQNEATLLMTDRSL